MQDVARHAGVAQSTVSRYFNHPSVVASKTAAKISDAIKSLDYRPNLVARHLKNKATNTIALFVPDIANLYYAELSKGVSEEARLRGYEVILYDTGYNRLREKDCLEMALRQQVDGLVIAYNFLDATLWSHLAASIMPSVLIDVCPPDHTWTALVVDNEKGIRLAVDCLRNLGHHHIAYLSEPPYVLPLILRQREFMRYMKLHGLAVNTRWMLVEKKQINRVKIGFNLGQQLLEGGSLPTAVMTSSDLVAVGALHAFLSAGLQVPGDLSLVGFDDLLLASYVFPALTTVRQPKYEMGLQGVELLLAQIGSDQQRPACCQIIEPTLIERSSTGPAQDGNRESGIGSREKQLRVEG